MRILIISNIFPPEFIGGYELVAADLATRLAHDGHEVMVLTSYMMGETPELFWPFAVRRTLQCLTATPDIIQAEDARIRGGVANITNLKSIGHALQEFRPTAVLCCNLAGLGPFGILKFLAEAGIASVLYLGDNIFGNGLRQGAEREDFLRYVGASEVMSRVALLPVSDGVLKEVSDFLSLHLSGVVGVPGWVDKKFAAPPRPTGHAMQSAPIRFVFSSRIAPHKGVHIVLEAVQELVRRNETHFVVDLYGAGEVAFTMQRTQLLGLEQLIRYKGMRSKAEMVPLFGEYDALLFPTWEREPFGFVAAEAAYQGCVPIMTATCGAAEWFVEGVNSIKIERSPMALAEAMMMFCRMAPAARQRLTDTCRRSGRALFDFERWYQRIYKVLDESQAMHRHADIAQVLNAVTLQLRLFL